jgi:hypothetical protein
MELKYFVEHLKRAHHWIKGFTRITPFNPHNNSTRQDCYYPFHRGRNRKRSSRTGFGVGPSPPSCPTHRHLTNPPSLHRHLPICTSLLPVLEREARAKNIPCLPRQQVSINPFPSLRIWRCFKATRWDITKDTSSPNKHLLARGKFLLQAQLPVPESPPLGSSRGLQVPMEATPSPRLGPWKCSALDRATDGVSAVRQS